MLVVVVLLIQTIFWGGKGYLNPKTATSLMWHNQEVPTSHVTLKRNGYRAVVRCYLFMLKQPVLSTEMVILLKVDRWCKHTYPSLNKKKIICQINCRVMCRLLAYFFLSVVIILPSVTMLGLTSASIGFVAHLNIVRFKYKVADLWGDSLNLPYKMYCG